MCDVLMTSSHHITSHTYILQNLTFVDTPGVLSGKKQSIGRSYDFTGVIDWFAEKSDLILLLFDAHKLDISDEFKEVITQLKRHDEKIRVVLNKADSIDTQSLMRVYGAMMWSLGKVKQTPEVTRVFISSFWDQPFKNQDNKALFQSERYGRKEGRKEGRMMQKGLENNPPFFYKKRGV